MKILCIGQSAYDITLPLNFYPEENEKYKLNGKVECGGGSSSNCACLLAKWGITSYFAGVIGNDHYGKMIQDEYKKLGVNTKYLEIDENVETTSSYIIANISNGSRTILTNKNKDIKMNLCEFDENEFDFILMDGYEKDVCIEAIKKNKNAITILDAGSLKEDTVVLAHIADYVVCSHDFAEDYSGIKISYDDEETIKKAYDFLKKELGHNVVITLEDKGCFTEIDGKYEIVPSIKVKAIDSTGAGDIYHGAFVYSLANNFDMRKTLKFSNITGALSVQKIGGRYSIPNLDEVIEKYNDNI